MPFQSQAQRRYFYATNPEMAATWEAHTPPGTRLPEKVGDAKAGHTPQAIKDVRNMAPGVSRVDKSAHHPHASSGAKAGMIALQRVWKTATLLPAMPQPTQVGLSGLKSQVQNELGRPNPVVMPTPATSPLKAGGGQATANASPRFNNPMPGAPNPLGAGSLAYAGARAPGMGDGFKWGAAYDGMTDLATHHYAPIAKKRELTGNEIQDLATSSSRILPTLFQHAGTPVHEMTSSPGWAGAISAIPGALAGAGAGAVLPSLLGGSQNLSGPGALAGGALGGGLAGLLA